jgi:hypothetical protein
MSLFLTMFQCGMEYPAAAGQVDHVIEVVRLLEIGNKIFVGKH